MNKYLSFFRLRFVNSLQYRSAAFAGIATQFFWGLMELLLFSAFYRAGDTAALPMRFDQLASYIWLQQAFLALFMNWYWDEDILSAITEGSIAYELCRPLDLYIMWFARSAASRLAKAVMRCMPILVIAAFLPPPFRLGLPASLPDFLLFLLSMLLGFSVVVAFAMLIYALCFFTISPMGIRIVAMSLMELLSGSVLPLPFLPDKLRAVLELLHAECTPADLRRPDRRQGAGVYHGAAGGMAGSAGGGGQGADESGPAPRRGAGRLNTEKGGFGHAAVSKIFFHPSAIGDAV